MTAADWGPAMARARAAFAAAEPPAVSPPTCRECAILRNELSMTKDRLGVARSSLDGVKARVELLAEENYKLRAELGDRPPTPREAEDIRRRMETLARQEDAAREALENCREDLHARIKERDAALRTIDNLHARIRAMGGTP